MNGCRTVQPILGLLLILCALPACAQTPEPRFAQPIDESSRVALPGSRVPRSLSSLDLGAVLPEMNVPGMTLVFRRSASQESALKALLSAQQNPQSPLYHHWLTPEAFAARFGVADDEIVAVEEWLTAHGFHVENVARNRDRITFSGNAAQVHSAFGAELHHYRVANEMHFGPASDLTLPAALAPEVAALLHISDFRPKPNVRAMRDADPDFTSAATQAHYLSPLDILTMYDAISPTPVQIAGVGQSVVIVGQSFVDTSPASAIRTFQTFVTGYVTSISPVLVPGSGVEATSLGDEGESEIDLEYASGVAYRGNVLFVYVGANQNYSVFDALAFAITQDIGAVVSISYGECESLLSATDLDQLNALFEEASAQGQTLVAAAGDSGSTACAPDSSAPGITPAEEQALSVSFPASSPYVTAVGGTEMAPGTFAPGSSSYWAGAPSRDVTSSLLSYVPEVVWNEGSASNGIAAGGGGASGYFARPAWQSAYPGMPAGNFRLLPDLALQSSVASPGFLVCSGDPALADQQGQTASCSNGLLGNNNKYTLAGGTSFAAPIFAGFVALLNAAEKVLGQGNIDPVLYSLAGGSGSAAFHDITSGSNACVAGAAECGNAGESGYTATQGYDEATGLGSIDLNALTAAWPPSNTANLLLSYLVLGGPTSPATPGQTIPLQITLDSAYFGDPVPTGTVSVSVDGTVVDSALAITTPGYAGVTTSYNLVAPTTVGSHLVAVNYAGDAKHGPASATYAMTVGDLMATGGVTLNVPNLTAPNGGTGSTLVTVTPTGGYDGRIVWSLLVNGPNDFSGCYRIDPLLVNNVSTAQLQIGVGTACNSAAKSSREAFQKIGPRPVASNQTQDPWHRTQARSIYACMLIAGCILGGTRKRRLSLLMALLLLPAVGVNMVGCGGGNGNSGLATGSSGSSTAPSVSYGFTLQGTDSVNSAITASTNFTLTVE